MVLVRLLVGIKVLNKYPHYEKRFTPNQSVVEIPCDRKVPIMIWLMAITIALKMLAGIAILPGLILTI